MDTAEMQNLRDRMSAEKEAARQQWNYGSDSWNDFVENKKDMGKRIIHPGIQNLLPSKEDRVERALDLCCGEGYSLALIKIPPASAHENTPADFSRYL